MPVVDFERINKKLQCVIVDKAFELIYTSNDLMPMAKEYGYPGDSPFIWNDKERFQLQCELDAIYAHLYGLEKEEMDYILDTFPIIKRKDISKYGSYRTKETILQLYDEFAWVSRRWLVLVRNRDSAALRYLNSYFNSIIINIRLIIRYFKNIY